MKPSKKLYSLSALALAITASYAQPVFAADEDETMEEVVATGTRLKGSAAAVLEERRQQAFVADIMGADQISRTGDGDAASALRRVTGLTLVDGKFIYVRGLGERYSSTQLNGAAVPSPDPTRSVIPLDLFPAEVIESLSVQKAYSPSMPAAFGGGNVDIRLKSIPSSRVFNFSAKLGGNTNNFDDGLTYEGSDTDWLGMDDGARDAPSSITQFWSPIGSESTSLDRIDTDISVEGLKDLNKDLTPETTTVSPNLGFDLAYGDSFESGFWTYGFLATLAYDNSWQNAEEYQLEQWSSQGEGSDRIYNFVRGYDDIDTTTHSVKTSAMFNFGIDYDKSNRVDLNYIVLNDTSDKVRTKIGISENVNESEGAKLNSKEVVYEERSLSSLQLRGQHTFTSLNLLGLDWIYSDSTSERLAPSNIDAVYILSDLNDDDFFDPMTEASLRRGRTAARYTFQELEDTVSNIGFNVTYPMYLGSVEVELKAGASMVEKEREAINRRFDIDSRALGGDYALSGNDINSIFSDSALDSATATRSVLNDTTIAGDLYTAEQTIDAYYVEGDFFIDNKYRISGGVRFEDFEQTALPYDPTSGEVQLTLDQNSVDDLTFQEDGVYPALALTYMPDDEMQFRVSFGQTVVRPDLREISAATYIDPLTEFPVSGTPGLETTDITNLDFRWEWYMLGGNNISVSLFNKQMDNPIEAVQSPAQDGPPLIRIANGEDATVTGIEFEFLQDLAFLGDTLGEFGQNAFITGNLTLSDSEIKLDPQNIVDQTGVSTSITNKTRRLTGHSEYVVNFQLGYDAPSGEHSATLVYNVFGERVIIAGIDGFDDAMEQPFHSLDVNYTYYPDFNSSVKVKLTNILDEQKEISFDDELLRSTTKGVGFSVSYKVEF